MVHTEHDPRWRLPCLVRIPGVDRERLDGLPDGQTTDRFFYGTTLEKAAAKAWRAGR
jgi:hypothetical protein